MKASSNYAVFYGAIKFSRLDSIRIPPEFFQRFQTFRKRIEIMNHIASNREVEDISPEAPHGEKKLKLIIQIPCYNEAGTLAIALAELTRELRGIDKI